MNILEELYIIVARYGNRNKTKSCPYRVLQAVEVRNSDYIIKYEKSLASALDEVVNVYKEMPDKIIYDRCVPRKPELLGSICNVTTDMYNVEDAVKSITYLGEETLLELLPLIDDFITNFITVCEEHLKEQADEKTRADDTLSRFKKIINGYIKKEKPDE